MYKTICVVMLSFLLSGITDAVAQDQKASVKKEMSKDLKSADIRVGSNGQHYANGRRLRFFPTIVDTGTSPAKYKKFELFYSRDKGNSWKKYSEVFKDWPP